jgi:hypothetical protein
MADASTPHEVGPAWEPLPVAVARLVTAGDQEFVERVREDLKASALKSPRQLKDGSFYAPNALVRCLELELRYAGLIPSSSHDQFSSVLVSPRVGRFQQLVADFERWLQQLPVEELSSFTFKDHLRKYLRRRVDAAYAKICDGIANCEIEAKGVLVDGKEHPAGNMPASAITKDMKIGDDDLLYQGLYKHSPAWKLVEVRAKQHRLSPQSPVSGPPSTSDAGLLAETAVTREPAAQPNGSQSKSGTGAKQKGTPGPDGYEDLLKEAHRAVGNRKAGELKKKHRERLTNWMKANGRTVVVDDNTFRKYGF